MISSTSAHAIPLIADTSPAPVAGGVSSFGTWHHIGRIAEVAVWDELNRARDRRDEALDAMRVSGGMTLDQFLESVTR